MAVATGLCAGSNYFNQPLLHAIASSLQVSEATAALTVTLAQVAYASGLLLLVPLGDKLERRGLAVSLMLLAALGLLVSGHARNFEMLVAGTVVTGIFSVAAQILVPMAAALSDPQRSGRAVGLVMSGLLTGILAARSVAGLLAEVDGWSTAYRGAALLMLALAAALWFVLPKSQNPAGAGYVDMLRSLGTLIVRHPRLRSRALLGALNFASVSVMFSTMALLLSGPAYGLSASSIGLIGLLGLAGAFMASVAGRLADRGWGQITSAVGVLMLALSWSLLWLGIDGLWWFLSGMLVMDVALASAHISDQSVIYRLEPAARSRINAVYMTSYFIGGASGSALGALAWSRGGWHAACVVGAGLTLLSGCALLNDQRIVRRQAAHDTPSGTSRVRAGHDAGRA